MTAARLLPPGTVVRLKTCRYCVEKWIIARREYEDRGFARDPSVHCRLDREHLRGTVQPYDTQYSRGILPVRFVDGVWRLAMAVDVWVVVPDGVEEPAATVVQINTRRPSRKGSDRIRPGTGPDRLIPALGQIPTRRAVAAGDLAAERRQQLINRGMQFSPGAHS